MTTGFQQGVLLRDQLRKTGTDDPAEFSLSYGRANEKTFGPMWDNAEAWDRHRLAEIDGETRGRTYTTDDESRQLGNTLDAVRLRDPRVLRAVCDVACTYLTADEAFVRSGLIERVVQLGAGLPRYTEPGPTRTELLTALGMPRKR